MILTYIEQQDPTFQPLLTQMYHTIKALVPEAEERMSYQMPTFYLKGNLVHFALFKKHLGFYPCPSGIEQFEEALKPYKTSKGAIQFPLDQPLPVDLIQAIVLTRISENLKTPYAWLDHYAKKLPGATSDYKEEWGAMRYQIKDKLFMMVGEDNLKRPIITLKGNPEKALALRAAFPDIFPGYYMNKNHWNSILVAGQVPDSVLKELIDTAYLLVFKGLTKKEQQWIQNPTPSI